MSLVAVVVVLAHAVAAPLCSWGYFRRYAIGRPPIGAITLGDVATMIAGVVLVPYLYLLVPRWLAGTLLAAATIGLLHLAWEPVLRARWALWPVVLALVALDVAAALRVGATSAPFLAANNAVLVMSAVGAANLWAQSGLRARDAAILGAALTAYDLVATAALPLTDALVGRLAGLPFAPLVAWPLGDGRWLAIGLGDLLLASVYPLVLRKAFGRRAGLVALALGLAALAAMLGALGLGPVRATLPAMAALGPLMVLQYLYWTRRLGPERTTYQYLLAEPLGGRR